LWVEGGGFHFFLMRIKTVSVDAVLHAGFFQQRENSTPMMPRRPDAWIGRKVCENAACKATRRAACNRRPAAAGAAVRQHVKMKMINPVAENSSVMPVNASAECRNDG
jgi:hypothetical protein